MFQTNPVVVNSFLMQRLSIVRINLHRCRPREWKRSIQVCYEVTQKTGSKCVIQSCSIGQFDNEHRPWAKNTGWKWPISYIREDCLLTDKSFHRSWDLSASSAPRNHNRTCDGLLVWARVLKGGCNLFFKNPRHSDWWNILRAHFTTSLTL